MATFDKIKKLAFLYKAAAFLSVASREDVRAALGYLLDILPPEQMQAIQEFYIDAADSNVPSEERQTALSNLEDLTDKILDEYIDDDRQHEIYKNLDIINNNAEEEFAGTVEDTFNESVEQAGESVDYQPGEEIAQTGQGSVTEDINKRKERDREYRAEKRRNPIFREKYLERQREYDKLRYQRKSQDKIDNVYKQRAIKKLIDSGLSKEQAVKQFENDIQSAVVDRVQSENMTKEEAANALSQIKSEEIAKYLSSLTTKSREGRTPLTQAERKKRSRLAKAYAEKVLVSNPEADINSIKAQVKSMSIEDLQKALENLAA